MTTNPSRAVLSTLLALSLVAVISGCGGPGTQPAGPAPASADRVFRVGVASFAPDAGADRLLEGLYAALEKEGFARGKNLEVEHKHAAGEIASIPTMLQALDGERLDLVVTLTTPVLASACHTVRATPVVFTYVTDPLAAGAGTSFDDHLPNVTGVGSFDAVDAAFDLLLKVVPEVKAVGTMYNASEANSTRVVTVAREIARQKGFRLEEVTVGGTGEVLQAAQSLVMRDIQAIWVTTDNTCAQAFAAIGMTAKKARIPVFANEKERIADGALVAIGASWREVGERTGAKAARVLRGESPKGMPFENYITSTVYLNHDLAKEIGVTFTPEVAALDGKVVQ